MSQEDVTRIQEQIKTLFAGQERIENHQSVFEGETRKTVNEIYNEIKTLKDQFAERLPTWATIIISILTASLGVCLGCLFSI